jgi:VanZ family protein
VTADKITTRNPWFWRAVICMTALFALSSVPQPENETAHQVLVVEPTWQTLLHVPAYFVLAALWWRTLRTQKWSIVAAVSGAVFISAVYGVLDEVHQYFVPGRFLSLTDASLNLVGAVTGGAWALIRDRQFTPVRPRH